MDKLPRVGLGVDVHPFEDGRTLHLAGLEWPGETGLAGQVYPVLTSDPDIEVPPHQPGQSHDLEDDAPPFATAPFATVPRLNRVRVTPTPPTGDGDGDADEEE